MTGLGIADSHHRRINYLRLSVTDRCNLRCVYCMPEGGVQLLDHQKILSYEEMLRAVRVAVGLGISKVRVTGGEPLVRRGLTGFIGELRKIEGIKDLSLTTNGLLLAGLARELAEAGLMRVNVSLDTLKPEVFKKITRSDGLELVLHGIDVALESGLRPVKINVVPIRGLNESELLDFARLAVEKSVEVRFIEFMPSNMEAWSGDMLVPADEVLGVIDAKYPLTPADSSERASGPSRLYDLSGGGRIGIISSLSNHFCASCNRLRLTASGSLRGCLFSADEVDLRAALRSGVGDDELAALISDVVRGKPEGHDLGSTLDTGCGKVKVDMSRIGG